MSKVLLLEFNEICPPLLKRWMEHGKLPNFSALHYSSQVFTTMADVSEPDYLEPWIQWYSIHTGLPYDDHRVFYLTDGPKAEHSDIWRCLAGLGKSVMNCGSMNARALAGTGVFYLPDPWCNNEPAWPTEIEVFKTVMAKLVQESTRGVALAVNEWLPFMTFLLRHGLAADTVRAVLTQVSSERLSQADVKWRLGSAGGSPDVRFVPALLSSNAPRFLRPSSSIAPLICNTHIGVTWTPTRFRSSPQRTRLRAMVTRCCLGIGGWPPCCGVSLLWRSRIPPSSCARH